MVAQKTHTNTRNAKLANYLLHMTQAQSGKVNNHAKQYAMN